ncbi:beta strand repeat-containing protein, partial [Methanobrevibacter curvatus]|uniref:beta strand repeat-containing protein n=1 Tax=Methanobrevibacter curvatus TaxID=49547 RepID=UPI0009FE1717
MYEKNASKNSYRAIIALILLLLGIFLIGAANAASVDITNSTAGGIHHAVDVVNDSDTINLAKGIYNYSSNSNNSAKNLNIEKNITLIGSSKSNTVIDFGKNQINISEGNSLNLYNLTLIVPYKYSNIDLSNNLNTNKTGNYTLHPLSNTSINFYNINFINTYNKYGITVSTVNFTSNKVVLYAYLYDDEGNPLDGDVSFYIDGKFSGRVYGANGQAIYITNLPQGNHNYYAEYIGNGIGWEYNNGTFSKNNISFTMPKSNGLNLLSAPLPTSGNRVWVDPINGNDGNSGLSIALAKRTVQEAIRVAGSNSYVILLPGTYSGSGNRDLTFSSSNNVTIIGNNTNGTVLITPAGYRFLRISGSSSAPKYINIYNIVTNRNTIDGLIYIESYSNVNIGNCEFYNSSTGWRGVVYLLGSYANLTVTDSIFKNCSGVDGAGIYAEGNYVKINITNTNFTNNSVTDEGASIHVLCHDGNNRVTNVTKLFLNNVIFKDNYAGWYGGAIDNYRFWIEARNVKFINCTAREYGGAIDNNYNFFNAWDTEFINCTSREYGGGGAIYNDNSEKSDVRLYGATFINCRNLATGSIGGGALGSGSGASSYGIHNSTFINCYSATFGGAVGVNGGQINITNSNFINNSAVQYGGAVATANDNIYITGSSFDGNFIVPTTYTPYGGAIASSGGSITVYSSNITNNYISNSRDLVLRGGAIASSGGTIRVYNSNIENNRVINTYSGSANPANYGGAISAAGSSAVYIYNSSILRNYVDAPGSSNTFGGAIGLVSGNIVINGSYVSHNYATGFGGGAGSTGGTLNLSYSNIVNNSAINGGGVGTSATINTLNCNFTANYASNNGGGVALLENTAKNIFSSSFVNNTAGGSGTAIYAAQTSAAVNINYNRFFNNNETPNRVYQTVWTVSSNTAVNLNLNWWGNNTYYTTGRTPGNYIVANINYNPGNITFYNRTAHFYYYLTTSNGAALNESRLPSYLGQTNVGVLSYSYNNSFNANYAHYIDVPYSPYAYLDGAFEVDWWKSAFTNISTVSTPNITSNTPAGKYKNITPLSATIKDNYGYVLSGLNVDFYIGGQYVGSAITDLNGVAYLNYTIGSAGNFSYTANYTYNDLNFLPVNTTKNLTFVKRNTTISLIQVDGNATKLLYLNATIVDEYGEFVDNVPIYFILNSGGNLTSGNSNSNGLVSASYIFNSIGNYTYYALFNGNGNYTGTNSSNYGGLVTAHIIFVYLTQDLYINSTGGNDSSFGSDWNNTLKSLLNALNKAISLGWNNYTVHIAPGVYAGANNTNQVIDKNVTLLAYSSLGGEIIFDGGNTAISGFVSNGSNLNTVNIINITYINGNGGAIKTNNTLLNIENSKFYNNTNTALNVYGAKTNISETHFIDNKGINGGAIILTNSEVSINNSEFKNNNASLGGAIYNNGGILNLTKSSLSNNSYTTIYTIVNNGNNIQNNTFNSNLGVLGIGFNNSKMDLNKYLINGNTIINNAGAILTVDGNANTIENGTINGGGNTNGILINGRFNIFNNNSINGLNGKGLIFSNTSRSNVFANGSISNNNNGGVLLDGNNNSLVGNNIVNNHAYGVNVTSPGIGSSEFTLINYNRIYGNQVALVNYGTNVNANFNWWGENNISSLFVNYASPSDLVLNNWYVLRLYLNTTSYNTTVSGTKKQYHNTSFTLSYKLTLNNLATANNPGLLPYFTVNVSTENITGSNLVINNGDIRSSDYNWINNILMTQYDFSKITASADNEILSLEVVPYIVELNIVKSANVSGTVLNGILVKYSINVTNLGPDNATGLLIGDKLDSKLIFVNSSNTRGTYYDSHLGVWNLSALNAGESLVLDIVAIVNGTGIISNIANITNLDQNNIGQISSGNISFTVASTVNISIVKTSNVSGNVLNGIDIRYSINVTNHGPDNATGVEVTDILPAGVIYRSSNASFGSYNHVTGKWYIGDLANGQSVFLDIVVTLNSTGNVVNIANVTVDQNNTGNNSSTPGNNTNLTVTPTVNISIIKTSNVSGSVSNGVDVKYTINVTNFGPDNATGVEITDNLPNGLIYKSSNTTVNSYNSANGKWYIGNLANGQSVFLDIVATLNSTGNVVNVANLTGVDQNNTGNNSSLPGNNTNLTVTSTVNISIIKTSNVSGNVLNGIDVKYTINVTNHGPNNATGVEITDSLPNGLIYKSSNATVNSYNSANGKWYIGNLANGQSVFLDIVVTL